MNALPLLPDSAPFAPEEITALNGVIARSTTEQRSWLSGFLAGLSAANRAVVGGVPANAIAPAARQLLTILYGSESGNAEAVADAAKRLAGKRGFAPRLVDMAEADLAALSAAGALMVVVSTWGEGEPPQRAAAFYRSLLADDAPRLEGLRYAVLALGDRAYAQFCATGREIDERLAALGAERTAERVDCDLDFEAPAEAWTTASLDALRRDETDGSAIIHVDFAPTIPAETAPAWTRRRPFAAEITEMVTLNGSGSSKQTVHLELSVAGSGIGYEPGDALAVVPENDPATAEAVMSAAQLGGDDALREELIAAYDVTTLTRPVVESYATLTGDKAIAALAEESAFRAYVDGRQVLDLLAEHPHRLSADQLRGLLRPLPARSYSIASSLKLVPDEAHLLVAPVRYRTHGRDRLGVASTFLADRRHAGGTARVFLKPNRHFRLPADPATPIVMIGPGTGVAPFRAFLQEREAVGAQGRSWLFFGERNFTHDFLYQLDWQAWLKEGVLTRMDVAFSRDQRDKVYVQHRLWERRAELWAWLQDGAHLYVCGDEKQMAKDVDAVLRRIAIDQAGFTAEGATEHLAALVRGGRYLRDVY